MIVLLFKRILSVYNNLILNINKKAQKNKIRYYVYIKKNS